MAMPGISETQSPSSRRMSAAGLSCSNWATRVMRRALREGAGATGSRLSANRRAGSGRCGTSWSDIYESPRGERAGGGVGGGVFPSLHITIQQDFLGVFGALQDAEKESVEHGGGFVVELGESALLALPHGLDEGHQACWFFPRGRGGRVWTHTISA